MLHSVLFSLFPEFRSVFFLARLVGRSKVQQRKCSVSYARPEAFQTLWTLSFAVHTPPARSSAVRLQPLALRPLMPSVETVCLSKGCPSVSQFVCLSLPVVSLPVCLLIHQQFDETVDLTSQMLCSNMHLVNFYLF